ncbi:CBS domain-containing protein [Flavisolibacter nicotianae]|uniref:CBS domain-containing protein n=1 Tax=Flavisolibacter nicotianae TaxID=2364882 RepID=UPI000EB542E2|nr:CBS domain-containing protein [Flavisolibacter nicotianae]
MGTVRNILQSKGSAVYSISPDHSVYDALELLEEKNLGCLVVVENEKLIGVFTERDYARKVVLKGKSSKETPVREIMTGQPIVVTPTTSCEVCMQLMTEKFIRHLPVVENGQLIGLVSIGDLVRMTISDKDYLIDTLSHYITG